MIMSLGMGTKDRHEQLHCLKTNLLRGLSAVRHIRSEWWGQGGGGGGFMCSLVALLHPHSQGMTKYDCNHI